MNNPALKQLNERVKEIEELLMSEKLNDCLCLDQLYRVTKDENKIITTKDVKLPQDKFEGMPKMHSKFGNPYVCLKEYERLIKDYLISALSFMYMDNMKTAYVTKALTKNFQSSNERIFFTVKDHVGFYFLAIKQLYKDLFNFDYYDLDYFKPNTKGVEKKELIDVLRELTYTDKFQDIIQSEEGDFDLAKFIDNHTTPLLKKLRTDKYIKAGLIVGYNNNSRTLAVIPHSEKNYEFFSGFVESPFFTMPITKEASSKLKLKADIRVKTKHADSGGENNGFLIHNFDTILKTISNFS